MLSAGRLPDCLKDGTEVRISDNQAILENGKPTAWILTRVLSNPRALLVSGPASFTMPYPNLRGCQDMRVVTYSVGVWPLLL